MAQTKLMCEVLSIALIMALSVLCGVAAPTENLLLTSSAAEPESVEGSTTTFPTSTSLKVQLISENSNMFVAASKSGWLHAHSERGGRASKFFEIPAGPNSYRFQSVKYPGQYIIVKNGKLRVGTPLSDNDVFEVESPQPTGLFALRLAKSEDCYMAFDEEGKRMDACSSSPRDGIWFYRVVVSP